MVAIVVGHEDGAAIREASNSAIIMETVGTAILAKARITRVPELRPATAAASRVSRDPLMETASSIATAPPTAPN
jgi:hypothetical protein